MDEQRERCKTDPFFLSGVLGYDFQPDVHAGMFDFLLRPDPSKPLRELSEIKNRLLLWSRGHYKTSAVVVNIVQLILTYPDIRILLMQGNLKMTKGLLAEVKSHFTGQNPKSLLPKMFPEFCAPKLGSQLEFCVPARVRKHLKEATVTAASPKAISTGQHYDAFFADDLVHANNFRNIEQLDKLEIEFSHFVPLIDPGYYTTVTGTRYHHADIYGRIIRRNQGDWAVSVKSCFRPDGSLLFPQRTAKDGRVIGFTPELLKQIQSDDPEMFSAQYLNQIIPAKTQLFPEALMLSSVRASKDPEFPATSPTIFTVDLASSKRAHADHSVIAAGKGSPAGIWVTDCVGGTYSPTELVIVLLQQVLKHRPVMVLIENCPGAQTFVDFARAMARERGINLPIQVMGAKNHKDAKYLRIAALESRFKNKQLFLVAGIPDFQRLLDEFTQFPKGEHDDRPDAIGMLVEHFSQGIVFQPKRSNLPWFMTQPQAAPVDNTPYWARKI
jgi:predicted phage terminase large subunit-like protein